MPRLDSSTTSAPAERLTAALNASRSTGAGTSNTGAMASGWSLNPDGATSQLLGERGRCSFSRRSPASIPGRYQRCIASACYSPPVTLGWLAFEITGSQAQLGLIHLCGFVPQFTLMLLGGVLADRIDARKLIGSAQSTAAVAMIMVGVATLLGLAQLWHLALGAFLWGLSAAIDEPARAAFFPRLLPRTLLGSAVPLISMAFGSSRIIAPSIAGFLIAAAGAPATFLVSAAAVSTMIAVLFLIRPAHSTSRPHGT